MSNWPKISHDKLSDTIILTEFEKHGFWLWDSTRRMNLAMRAKTRDAAFMEALTYYQNRLLEVEKAHDDLSAKVNAFIDQFHDECED